MLKITKTDRNGFSLYHSRVQILANFLISQKDKEKIKQAISFIDSTLKLNKIWVKIIKTVLIKGRGIKLLNL